MALNLQLPEATDFPAAVFTQDGEFVMVGHKEKCEMKAEEIGGLYCLIDSRTGAPFIKSDFEREDIGTTYRAAYIGETVLTAAEHAGLSDEELRAEALAEAQRADIIDMEEDDAEVAAPRFTRAAFDSKLTIGDWTE